MSSLFVTICIQFTNILIQFVATKFQIKKQQNKLTDGKDGRTYAHG